MCDYDRPEFYNSKLVKTRSSHQCCECRDTISSDSLMEKASGKWNRDFASFYTCDRCLKIREICIYYSVLDCWAHGELYNDIFDCAILPSEDEETPDGVSWLQEIDGRLILVGKYLNAIATARIYHQDFYRLELVWGL